MATCTCDPARYSYLIADAGQRHCLRCGWPLSATDPRQHVEPVTPVTVEQDHDRFRFLSPDDRRELMTIWENVAAGVKLLRLLHSILKGA